MTTITLELTLAEAETLKHLVFQYGTKWLLTACDEEGFDREISMRIHAEQRAFFDRIDTLVKWAKA
jgi:hypothetical protein